VRQTQNLRYNNNNFHKPRLNRQPLPTATFLISNKPIFGGNLHYRLGVTKAQGRRASDIAAVCDMFYRHARLDEELSYLAVYSNQVVSQRRFAYVKRTLILGRMFTDIQKRRINFHANYF